MFVLFVLFDVFVQFVCVNKRRAKTQRSKRAMEERAPKLVENCKKSLMLKGPNVSDIVTTALKDLVSSAVFPLFRTVGV